MLEDFTVIDLLAAELGARQHELADPATGRVRRFKFAPGEATACPRWAALRFAAIEGFEVRDAKGTRFRIAATREPEPVPPLAPDETVARYEELTQEALLARCLATGDASGFGKGTRKGELVSWLIGREIGKDAKAKAQPEDELGEIELEDRVEERAA